MRTVELAPHEFVANALFNDDGLAPYFACDSQVKTGDGSVAGEFRTHGERWVVRLSYQSSNIVHPGPTTPAGTDFQVETIREYRLKISRHPEEDDAEQQSFVGHLAPRWVGMRGEREDGTTTEIPVPDGFGEGVNVRLTGSNIRFDRYLHLLREGMAAVGIAGRYFRNPHPYSNVQDAERYVRIHENASGPIHARDGPIAEMGHLLENDRQGYRKVVQNDDDHHGRNLPGYYHTVTLGPRRIREAFPSHELPKEVKHYYTKEAKDRDPDDPLAHPKIGASLQTSLVPNDETVRLEDLDQLTRELDQTVLSMLADAGLDVAPTEGNGPYVTDAYFEPAVSEGGPNPLGLDLTTVQMEQEHVVVRHLADGLSPTAWESLKTLVTDGGDLSPADIAEENNRHVGSVRRALQEIDDLVEREYAQVSLRSQYVAEIVHEAVEEARDATRRAADAAAKAMEAAKRGLDETMSAFIAWAARHGVDVKDREEAKLKLRFHGVTSSDEAAETLAYGFDLWTDAGMPAERFREAKVIFDGEYRGRSRAWRYL